MLEVLLKTTEENLLMQFLLQLNSLRKEKVLFCFFLLCSDLEHLLKYFLSTSVLQDLEEVDFCFQSLCNEEGRKFAVPKAINCLALFYCLDNRIFVKDIQ